MLRPPSPVPSGVSLQSDESMPLPFNFSSDPVQHEPDELRADVTQGQSRCEVCKQVLRDSVIITTCGHSFCRQCISSYLEQPGPPGDQACPQCGETCRTQPPLQPPLDDEHTDRAGSNYTKKKLDNDALRRVKENHKASLKRRFENISEGIIKPGAEILLNKIYTDLYITEGESEGVNKEHEVWQLESTSKTRTTEDTPINCNDIFKHLPGQQKHTRTVITKGVAGIGKTVSVQKFILDWIDGVANQDIDFMFPLPLRELNLVRGERYSLHKLLLDFYPELKELNGGEDYKNCQVVFIFDGLDESRLTLNLQQSMMVSDVQSTSSINVLVLSLIKGTLLPSALVWITSRPAAASKISAQYVDQVTEIRGFSDPQKEEYFRKRISDDSLSDRIISHIKASRSLYIMCHIPVFCWIAATVLQEMLGKKNIKCIPKTLTEMFIHFLLIQTTKKNQKYQSRTEKDQEKILESQKEILLKMAELAFKSLENGNLMFYDEDLRECGMDVSEASVYSGMCTEIFKEEPVFHQRKVYCFVHLSLQEFLAALYVFHSYMTKKYDALKSFLTEEQRGKPPSSPILPPQWSARLIAKDLQLHVLLKSAVDEALKSKNGHMDLFLRFLMGISLESNQRLLQGLLNKIYNTSKGIKETCHYIKKLNREDLSPERCINLFHCLFEMNDHSMHKEIQTLLSSKNSKQKFSPAHCSALAHMLLMSEEILDEFDLTKYNTSDEGRRRLIPAARYCRKAQLADCNLTDRSCGIVATLLQSTNSVLELDLSHNDLGDSGVHLLSKGLSSPHCKLQTLRLSNCGISDEGYVCLALALMLNPSCVKELDVSNNHPGESTQKLLSDTLEDPHHKVETLQFADCKLTNKSCEVVASRLQSPNFLLQLDLSHNDLGDSGVQLLSKGMANYSCKLHTLRLSNCGISDEGFVCLALTLMLNPSCVKELDVSNNHPGESAQKLLSDTLEDPKRTVEALQLADCKLTDKFCEIVASLLQSPNSLKELDLSHNDLGDSGVQLLSKALSSAHCKLQTLRLSDCLILEKGCDYLASALTSNPSCLKELDLSYNNPGKSERKLLSAQLEDPDRKPQIKTDNPTVNRARQRLLRYACKLTLGPNTAHRILSLSEGNRKVTCVREKQPYPDHPERFDSCYQVLCREGLSGRCYWEAEWSGYETRIAVAYKSIKRKGQSEESGMGCNAKSWSLFGSPNKYYVRHNNEETCILVPSTHSRRVGVYLDWPAGTLSFYSVFSDTLTHLHTFHSTFTELLYPGFDVWFSGSTVSLCQIT